MPKACVRYCGVAITRRHRFRGGSTPRRPYSLPVADTFHFFRNCCRRFNSHVHLPARRYIVVNAADVSPSPNEARGRFSCAKFSATQWEIQNANWSFLERRPGHHPARTVPIGNIRTHNNPRANGPDLGRTRLV